MIDKKFIILVNLVNWPESYDFEFTIGLNYLFSVFFLYTATFIRIKLEIRMGEPHIKELVMIVAI